ncbi:hypothetical protein PIB30_052313 [Stylosanthes scabra]|uniref:Uncharacterized protein n=1 Tax=Stylosanthes scabra TaxID=79078 RepID=A0ABU6UJ02_9FABA|nr:hypothetical protein [Stylosanthes scabra]
MFKNAWLLVKRWERKEDSHDEGLDTAEIKIQIWGLPEHYKTTKLGHEENTCERARRDGEEAKEVSKKLGPLLKAEVVGRKINRNNQGEDKEGARDEEAERKKKERLTEKLMEKLAALSITEQKEKHNGEDREQHRSQKKLVITIEEEKHKEKEE